MGYPSPFRRKPWWSWRALCANHQGGFQMLCFWWRVWNPSIRKGTNWGMIDDFFFGGEIVVWLDFSGFPMAFDMIFHDLGHDSWSSEGSWFAKTCHKTWHSTVVLLGLLEHQKSSTRALRGRSGFDQMIWHSAGYHFQNPFVPKNPKSGRKGVLAQNLFFKKKRTLDFQEVVKAIKPLVLTDLQSSASEERLQR